MRNTKELHLRLVCLFFFQMQSMRSHLNFNGHKNHFIWFVCGIYALSLMVLLHSLYMFGLFDYGINVYIFRVIILSKVSIGRHITVYIIYLFFLWNVKKRFEQLNTLLRYMKDNREHRRCQVFSDNFFFIFRYKIHSNYNSAIRRINKREIDEEDAFVVTRLARLHDSLTNITEIINTCYSVQVNY